MSPVLWDGKDPPRREGIIRDGGCGLALFVTALFWLLAVGVVLVLTGCLTEPEEPLCVITTHYATLTMDSTALAGLRADSVVTETIPCSEFNPRKTKRP